MSDNDIVEESRRSKIVETLWLFWAMSLTGLNNGIMGPTVLELMHLTYSDPSCMQFAFVAQGVGFLVAIVTASALISRCRASLLLCSSLVLGTVTNAGIPWCATFAGLGVAVFFQGFAKGILDFAIIARCTQVWPHSHGFALQFVATGVATGAVLSPFICEPFLDRVNHLSAAGSRLATGSRSLANCITVPANNSREIVTSAFDQVIYPYIIVSGISLPPAAMFLYYYLTQKQQTLDTWHYVSVPDSTHPLVDDNRPLVIKRRMLLVLILLFHIPFAGFYLTYSDLLAPFGITSHLRISSSRMATMTAVFWIMFLVGRVVTTCFSCMLTQFVILIMNSVGIVASAIFLAVTGDRLEIALWVGTCALSYFEAPFLPGALSWLGEYLSLDKSLITLTFIGAGMGELFLPYIAGYVFSNYTPSAFMLSILVIVLCQTAIFVAMYIIKRYVAPVSRD